MGQSWASIYIIAYARSKIGQHRDVNGCATFVSEAYAAGCAQAKVDKPFSASGSVAGILSQFPASAISSDLGSAGLADLIVFGDDEHVMLYANTNHVVGTAGGKTPGVPTTVQELEIGSVITSNHPKAPVPVKVVRTGEATPGDAVSNAVSAAEAVPGQLFGAMFGWVPTFALNAGVLLIAAALVYVGTKQVVGGAEGTV